MNPREPIVGDFGTYTAVETADGSWTLYSSLDDEMCHSLDGAVGEARYNFIEGCQLEQLLISQGSVAILEIGFGCGVNFLETLKTIGNRPFEYVALERDQKMVEKLSLPLKQCQLLFGEAAETIEQLIAAEKKFDVIYQDPFSPKKNPILWTPQWFSKLRMVVKKGAILSTYSASRAVREALAQTGWQVFPRKGFGRKRAATLAIAI